MSELPSWYGQRQRIGGVALIINHRDDAPADQRPDFGEMAGLRADLVENVEVIAVNSGEFDFGFAVCTDCGYAESETLADAKGGIALPGAMPRHLPLYRASGMPCGGATGRAAVLRNVHFSAAQFTDVVRFELTGMLGVDRVALTTLGHALAQGAAEVLELDQREIRMACDVPTGDRRVVRLFDAVGHGGSHMSELFGARRTGFAAARQVLRRSDAHHEKCRTACISCILSSASQHDAKAGWLDRRLALGVLDAGVGGVRKPLVAKAVPPPTAPRAKAPSDTDILATLLSRAGARKPGGR